MAPYLNDILPPIWLIFTQSAELYPLFSLQYDENYENFINNLASMSYCHHMQHVLYFMIDTVKNSLTFHQLCKNSCQQYGRC